MADSTKQITFQIQAADTKTQARVGRIVTPHGIINTPTFVPVATQASVKALDGADLETIGVELVLGNTYHLHLRPGEEIIAKFGGLARFMNWVEDGPASVLLQRGKPTMTDSGGFQVFSLGVGGDVKLLREDTVVARGPAAGFPPRTPTRGPLLGGPPTRVTPRPRQIFDPLVLDESRPKLTRITEKGVYFQSHIDGRKLLLTPEKSIQIQEKLGADLVVAFDDLESPHYSHEQTKKSLERTENWLLRSAKAHSRHDQLLYGVTHGGQFKDLRFQSARFVDQHFEAIALGGAHRDKQNMYEVIRWTVDNVDPDKPRHMLGVGEIDDIFHITSLGIDTFDCVVPTRLARSGYVFISPPQGNLGNRFRFDITKSRFAGDKKPLDQRCDCRVCQQYTRGYIHHLFKSRELLAYRLATYHNVWFFTNLLREVRETIVGGKFREMMKKWLL